MRLPAAALPEAAARLLWRQYGPQVAVTFPSPRTAGQWELTAQDWVGAIPLGALTLQLEPKLPVASLLRMLEIAHELPLQILPELARMATTAQLFDRLAAVLAQRVLHRARQGFSRAYIPETAELPFVRGRIDLNRTLLRDARQEITCIFERQTSDQPDNQILAWTLYRLSRLPLLRQETRRLAVRALRALGGVTLQPFTAADVAAHLQDSRAYTRLNSDYRPLHALCRLFLTGCGPREGRGALATPSFLVNTAQLFETFVAAWLRRQLPPNMRLSAQERVQLTAGTGPHFRLDMVLVARENNRPVAVLDTKYKGGPPASRDVAQVAAYAHARDCRRAFLVYPTPLPTPLRARVGSVTVADACFDLAAADLDAAGSAFLARLLES